MQVLGDFYGAFAYYVTPPGAARLLQLTRPRCNSKKPDIAMRAACLGSGLLHCLSRSPKSHPTCDVANLTRAYPPALRCLKPVRVLWRREVRARGAPSHYGWVVHVHVPGRAQQSLVHKICWPTEAPCVCLYAHSNTAHRW